MKFCCSPRYRQCPAQRIKAGKAIKTYWQLKDKTKPSITRKYPADLTGKRFGKLIALRPAYMTSRGWTWWVRCECSVEKVIRKDQLVSGKTKSCGCARVKNQACEMVGRKFGRLIVLKQSESKRNRHGSSLTRWLCRCQCKKEVIVTGNALRCGKTKSCGCLSTRAWLQPGESIKRVLLKTYKRSAIARGLPWEITDEKFYALIAGICYYCGEKPSNVVRKTGLKGTLTCNGVDRLENTLGYTPNNCVPCCSQCNEMKMDKSLEEFYHKMKQILTRHPDAILHPSKYLPKPLMGVSSHGV